MMDQLNQNALRAELKPAYERAAELIRGTQSRSPALASP
jgi:hypothetical protein